MALSKLFSRLVVFDRLFLSHLGTRFFLPQSSCCVFTGRKRILPQKYECGKTLVLPLPVSPHLLRISELTETWRHQLTTVPRLPFTHLKNEPPVTITLQGSSFKIAYSALGYFQVVISQLISLETEALRFTFPQMRLTLKFPPLSLDIFTRFAVGLRCIRCTLHRAADFFNCRFWRERAGFSTPQYCPLPQLLTLACPNQ